MPCSCGVCQECDWARNHEDEIGNLDHIRTLEAQRDELLAALEALTAVASMSRRYTHTGHADRQRTRRDPQSTGGQRQWNVAYS